MPFSSVQSGLLTRRRPPKQHLVGNEQETYRRPYFGVEAASSNIDDKTLHEYYLWPFMDGLRAGAASVMCSYNRVNSTYACDSDELLNSILKKELGFAGFVLLDWNAQHGVDSANAGLDMVMPLGGAWGQNLTDAVRNGSVSESRLTDMATRSGLHAPGQAFFIHLSIAAADLVLTQGSLPHGISSARTRPTSRSPALA